MLGVVEFIQKILMPVMSYILIEGKDFLDYLSPLRSDLKLRILLNLLSGEKKVAELGEEFKSRDTTILHVLREFLDLKLVTKNHGKYKLSTLGIIEGDCFKEFLSGLEVIEKFRDFWLGHDVSNIPSFLVTNLGALKDATLVQTEPSELGVVHKEFIDRIKPSKNIWGVSPIFHPDFTSVFERLLGQGCCVELIVSGQVLEKIMSLADVEIAKKYLESQKLKVFVKDDVKVALAVTEGSFSLGLFTLEGKYDDSMDLVSDSDEAINWGRFLFEKLKKDSIALNF